MKLKQGDTIGIIALAGNCDKDTVLQACENLEKLGFKTKLSKNIFDENRYLAGSDEDKINELYKFFQDPEIKLILNARGGFGSIRLINKIDYEIIKNNPKPFCGFSDITALLLMFYKKCGLITYHGPMLCSDFGHSSAPSLALPLGEGTLTDFLKAINDDLLEFTGSKVYKQGSAEGILWGGNLSTIASLCGQDFIPDEDFIFFAEDLNEPVYKIDKMFTQLFNIEKFNKNCKGIVLGDFLNIDNEDWLENFFNSFIIPTIYIQGITHSKEKITLPIGRKAKLEGLKLNIE